MIHKRIKKGDLYELHLALQDKQYLTFGSP